MLDLKTIVDFENTFDYRLKSPVDDSDLPVLFKLRSIESKYVQAKRREIYQNEPDIDSEELQLVLCAHCVVDVDGEVQLPDSDKAMNPKKFSDVLKVFRDNTWIVRHQLLLAVADGKNFTKG